MKVTVYDTTRQVPAWRRFYECGLAVAYYTHKRTRTVLRESRKRNATHGSRGLATVDPQVLVLWWCGQSLYRAHGGPTARVLSASDFSDRSDINFFPISSRPKVRFQSYDCCFLYSTAWQGSYDRWVIKTGDVIYDTRQLKILTKYFINNSL